MCVNTTINPRGVIGGTAPPGSCLLKKLSFRLLPDSHKEEEIECWSRFTGHLVQQFLSHFSVLGTLITAAGTGHSNDDHTAPSSFTLIARVLMDDEAETKADE